MSAPKLKKGSNSIVVSIPINLEIHHSDLDSIQCLLISLDQKDRMKLFQEIQQLLVASTNKPENKL